MKYTSRSITVGIVGVAALILVLGVLPAFAQRPEIKSMSATHGSYDQVITLKGTGFGNSAANLVVMFGAAKATVKSVTEQVLEVKVPAGATYDNIAVTNTASGLTGYSREQFFINFHGDGTGFNLANLDGQFDFPAAPASIMEGLFDLCLCDIDGDGKTDVAAAKSNVSSLEYYMNATAAPGGPPSFNKTSSAANKFRQVQCGDLDGDGRPELIASDAENLNSITIFKNLSSPGAVSLQKQAPLSFPPRIPKRIEIADMDLDGKPELIFSDEQSPGTVVVLKNQSTVGAISFATTPIVITLPEGATSTSPLAVQDLDGDLLPEIVTSQFARSSNVYIVKNNSTPGSLSLTNITQLSTNSLINNVRIGDIDGDGKPDIAYTSITPSTAVGVLLNQSTSTALAFTSITSANVPALSLASFFPFGLDLGDMDGDGKLEIVTSSYRSNAIAILNNSSTPGAVSFTQYIKAPTTSVNQHVAVGDVDNDGKPDIVFTSSDDTNLNIKSSKISVLRNTLCMKPIIDPAGPVNVCSTGDPVKLIATYGGGVSYVWKDGAGTTVSTASNEYTPTVSGTYQVTANSPGCSRTSNIVNYTVTAGPANTTVTATNTGPVCAGSNLSLNVTDLGAGYTYAWTGPNGFSQSVRNPSITNAQLDNAGEYTVKIFATAAGGCLLKTTTTNAVVVVFPEFSVGGGPADLVSCSSFPGNPPLAVFPMSTSEFTYTWFLNGAAVSNTPTLSIDPSGGDYHFSVKSIVAPSCPAVPSSHKIFALLPPPTSVFSAPATACKGELVTFNNTSSVDNAQSPAYAWKFGDGETSADKDATHTYTSITGSPFTVELTVSYANGTCAKVSTQTIQITEAPLLAITNADNQYKLCPDGSLELEATSGFSSYQWNVSGETAATIIISEPGEYTVQAQAANGCKLTTSRTITEFDDLPVTASASPPAINEGEQTQLSAVNLLDYTWEPAETVSDPSVAEPTATPLVSTSYTVSGKDANGCARTATVLVEVRGNAIVTKLFPGNFFSPNGDEQNPFWVVGQIDQYPQCGVVIYDDKGVKVFDAKPYQNNWDGTFNGKKLPDGVYYFVIRCEGEESTPRMGSITILK